MIETNRKRTQAQTGIAWSRVIKSMLIYYHWSIDDLARRLGMSRANVSLWANGRPPRTEGADREYPDPSLSIVERVADVAGVDPLDLCRMIWGDLDISDRAWDEAGRSYYARLLDRVRYGTESDQEAAQRELLDLLNRR